MIVIDTNVLVYAHRRDSQWHSQASDCVRALAESGAAWGIPWPCLHEFLAIVTHPRIYAPPSSLDQAIAQIEAWFEAPNVNVLGETSDHWDHLKPLLRSSKIVGGAVHDGRIAAMCVAHRANELLTADRDFSRFPSLRIRNPLVA